MINEYSLDKVYELLQNKEVNTMSIDNIAEISNIIIWQIDKDLKVSYISSNIEKAMDINANQLLNHNLTTFKYREVSKFLLNTINKAKKNVKNIEVTTSDFYLLNSDGNSFWYRVMVKPYLKDNKFDQMIGMSWDATLNMRNKELEYEKTALYENMFQCSQSLILIIHPESFKIIDFNQETKSYLGLDYSKKQHSFLDYCSNFDLLFNSIKSNFEESGNSALLINLSVADNNKRAAKIYLSKITISDNNNKDNRNKSFYLIQAIIVDITEKIETENELSKLLQKYVTFFDSSPIAFWEVDLSLLKIYLNSLNIPSRVKFVNYIKQNPEILITALKLLVIITVNKQTLYMFNCSDIYDLRDHFSKFTGDHSASFFAIMLNQVYHSLDYCEEEAILADKNNNELRLIVRWNIINKDNTFPVKAIVSMVNVTDKYLYFEKLIEQSNEIRQINENLKIALEKEQQLALEANISNEIKNRFLATMSHEFRTPLNGIQGMTQLLMKTNLNDEQTQLLNILEDSAKNLLTLVDDIFDFVKLDSSNVEIVENLFSLYDLCQSAIQNYSKEAFRKDIDIFLDWDFSYADFVIGDMSRFRQVLMNLIDNAVKFTHQGSVILALNSVKQVLNNSCLYSFSITNTNIKIKPENKKNLFKIFSQGDNSLERNRSGTGLGLALVKQILTLMNGNISLIDRNDNTTQFDFTVIFKVEQTQYPKLPEINNRLPVNILVIDNDNLLYHKIGKYFFEKNIKLEIISIIQFLKSLSSNKKHYDFIICDAINLNENTENNLTLINLLNKMDSKLILLYRQKDLLDTKKISDLHKLYKPLNIIELKKTIQMICQKSSE